MATILFGRFETIGPAEHAARRLLQTGIAEDDISIFHLNAPGQHHVLPLGGDASADPEAKPARETSMVGAALGALLLGALGGALAGSFLPSYWWLIGLIGACVGAYLGSFMGALAGLSWQANRNRRRPPANDSAIHTLDKAGIVLAANLRAPEKSVIIEAVLRAHGGRDIEMTEGVWDRGWADFDAAHESAAHEPDRTEERPLVATRER